MLDLRSKIILKFLAKECSEGSYKVLDISDLIDSMPKKFRADTETLKQIIKHLENGEYLSVKYIDDTVVCVCPLPFGRQFIENDDTMNKNKKVISRIGIKNATIMLIFALIGSFLGTLIYNILL